MAAPAAAAVPSNKIALEQIALSEDEIEDFSAQAAAYTEAGTYTFSRINADPNNPIDFVLAVYGFTPTNSNCTVWVDMGSYSWYMPIGVHDNNNSQNMDFRNQIGSDGNWKFYAIPTSYCVGNGALANVWDDDWRWHLVY